MRVPAAFLVVVGDELVSGLKSDANGLQLGHWLEDLGCEIRARALLPDQDGVVSEVIAGALGIPGIEIVAVTGGMGSGENDRTREAVSRGLGLPLEFDPEALKSVEQWYRDRSRAVPDNARRLAFRPQGSEWLHNPAGPTSGFLVDRGRTCLVALPGRPRELEETFQRAVLGHLRGRLAGAGTQKTITLRIAGLTEAEVAPRVASVISGMTGLKVAFVSSQGEVAIRLTVRADGAEDVDQNVQAAAAALESKLGEDIYGRDETSLVEVVRGLCAQRGFKVATAESITGGMLAKTIVDSAGSGSFYAGGMIPYSDQLKVKLAGVPQEALQNFGPVSPGVVRHLAEGIRQSFEADVGIATSGIAGPGGGTAERPVGLTYVALALPQGTVVRKHLLAGSRNSIRALAAVMALEQFRRVLLDLPLLGEAVEIVDGGGER